MTARQISRLAAIAVALLLILAACGGGTADDTSGGTGDDPVTDTTGDSTGTPTTTGGTAAPGEPLFMITWEGGFTSAEILATQGPAYVVTADGQLVFQGVVDEMFPGPLVPPYMVTDVADLLPDLQNMIDRIGVADIDEQIDDPTGGMVADASTTVLTYFDENGAHRYGVYALGFDPQSESEPRVVALNDLMLTLQDASLGADAEPFASDRWQVVANPDFVSGADAGVGDDVRPYPIEIAVEDFEHETFGFACTVLEGADAEAAAEAFADATQVTVWDTGSGQIRLVPRPLLPGEDGCTEQA